MPVLLGCLVVVAFVGALWTSRRHTRRERRIGDGLRALAARLGDPSAPAGGDVDAALAVVARAAEAVLGRARESRHLARSMAGALESLPLGVVVSAPGGEIVFRNSAADALLGTRAADALASRALAELLAEAAAGGAGSRPLDLYGPPPRTLSLSAVPLEDGAGAVTVEDVSDRRRLEAVRRDFVANVSHELKTPVAALGLLAETLVSEEEAAVVQRLAGRMQLEAFRVARIIDDLLDLSRLEAADTTIRDAVRVRDVIAQAVERVQPAAGARAIRLAVREAPTSWTVPGDRRQLVSAMANLLENAVKYSEDDSTVEVGARTDGSHVDLVVRDHGVGIPSRDLDRIFERFYRVDRGRGRDTGGTGLGLSIVRHIASNHGGEVLVESVEGEGSTFTLRVPAEPGPVGLVAQAG